MPGLVRGVARTAAIAGTASAVSGRVHKHQRDKWAQQAQPAPQYTAAPPQYAAPPPAAPQPAPAAAGGTDDVIAQLEKLGQLKAAGVLTEAEFDAQKAKLLG